LETAGQTFFVLTTGIRTSIEWFESPGLPSNRR